MSFITKFCSFALLCSELKNYNCWVFSSIFSNFVLFVKKKKEKKKKQVWTILAPDFYTRVLEKSHLVGEMKTLKPFCSNLKSTV